MSAATDEPRRLTPTERAHALAMAYAARQASAPESAVEITRNAKGDYQYTVTVRGEDVQACETLALGVSDRLAEKYPRESNGAA
jgi:hypothetical protein